ncbi:MAG: hypothetical protein LiPW41_457 [Parcubacteria group bacterium LiPW_41]|nr:MAG: hypothetical protein LiPW41_457 [Parcubacteria group bacterium LiPW_41]
MQGKNKIVVPKEDKKLKAEIRDDLKRISRLDEKRIAVRQFLIEAGKLKNKKFDFIVCPLFSGFIPATLFRVLYNKNLPLFEYITTSSLAKDIIAIEKGNYKIFFSDKARPILDGIKKDILIFIEQNKLDLLKAKILLIDSNVASGITLAYFIQVLKELDYNFKNLTVIITDSRANNKKLKKVSSNLLRGGKLILFNQKNMTNKVFDNVLTLSASKKDNRTFKVFNGREIKYDAKQISFYPYFLSLELLKEERKKG